MREKTLTIGGASVTLTEVDDRMVKITLNPPSAIHMTPDQMRTLGQAMQVFAEALID